MKNDNEDLGEEFRVGEKWVTRRKTYDPGFKEKIIKGVEEAKKSGQSISEYLKLQGLTLSHYHSFKRSLEKRSSDFKELPQGKMPPLRKISGGTLELRKISGGTLELHEDDELAAGIDDRIEALEAKVANLKELKKNL